jgi:hypothetical protein
MPNNRHPGFFMSTKKFTPLQHTEFTVA